MSNAVTPARPPCIDHVSRETLEIVSYRVTCDGAPVQIEGELRSGMCFYFRSRHRGVTLGIGETVEQAAGDPEALSMRLEGFPDDRHPLSSISNPMPLVTFMIEVRESILAYADRGTTES